MLDTKRTAENMAAHVVKTAPSASVSVRRVGRGWQLVGHYHDARGKQHPVFVSSRDDWFRLLGQLSNARRNERQP